MALSWFQMPDLPICRRVLRYNSYQKTYIYEERPSRGSLFCQRTLCYNKGIMKNNRLIQIASELQSLAQAGLFYGKDMYDKERYERIRELSAELLALETEADVREIHELFCLDYGYQTPKIDTRAAIIRDNQILLVRENDGRWSLPGGWCEVNLSPAENTIKEAKEESGRDIKIHSVIAVQNRAAHNLPHYIYGVVKIFYLCEEVGGEFTSNIETNAAAYFCEDDLPELSEEKNTKEQISMCFEAYRADHWTTQFD